MGLDISLHLMNFKESAEGGEVSWKALMGQLFCLTLLLQDS